MKFCVKREFNFSKNGLLHTEWIHPSAVQKVDNRGLEFAVAPRLSTLRLTAPTSCQPASAVAYMANISCVVSRFQLRLTQLMQLTELSGAFQKTKAMDL